MKRFATAALAALTFVAPLAATGTAAADNGRHNGWRNDRDHDRWDRRDDRRDDRRHYRDGYRDGRQAQRWDNRRYNGYWYQNRFYYGPPPASYYGARYDYRPFRRGERIPAYYRDRYYAVDYRHYHVAPPPRGYHYVRSRDNGELLLVGLTTGVILGAILANN